MWVMGLPFFHYDDEEYNDKNRRTKMEEEEKVCEKAGDASKVVG